MLASQRLQIEQSQTRQRIAAALENTELTTEERSAMDADTQRMSQIEVELRGALVAEGEPTETPSEDGEGRELREIETRAAFGNFLNEVVNDVQLSGPEAELRTAMLGEGAGRGIVPLQMLLSPAELRSWQERNELETRARTPVATAAATEANQQSIAARVFARSVLGYFGVPMPTLPPSSAGYPIMTGGTTFSQQATAGEQLAVAGSFGGELLDNVRATGSYEYSVEDVQKLIGLEEAFSAIFAKV